MNKKELSNVVAEKLECTKKSAAEMVDVVFETITEALVEGDVVNLVGFGKFETVMVAEKMARNPKTNTEVLVKAHRKPKFKASSAVKDALN